MIQALLELGAVAFSVLMFTILLACVLHPLLPPLPEEDDDQK